MYVLVLPFAVKACADCAYETGSEPDAGGIGVPGGTTGAGGFPVGFPAGGLLPFPFPGVPCCPPDVGGVVGGTCGGVGGVGGGGVVGGTGGGGVVGLVGTTAGVLGATVLNSYT